MILGHHLLWAGRERQRPLGPPDLDLGSGGNCISKVVARNEMKYNRPVEAVHARFLVAQVRSYALIRTPWA